MKRPEVRTGLQVLLTILGVVMLAAGAVALIFGATSVVGVEEPSPAVDSEMRFFATWYAASGVLLLWASPRLEARGSLIRWVAVVFFIAGCARAISWLVVGEPPGIAMLLMVIELAFPFVIIPWQGAVERSAIDSTGIRPRAES